MPISLESGLSISTITPGPSAGEDDAQVNLRQFAQFAREHEASIFTYVLRMVSSREDAEDITQEALYQAWRTWNQVDPEAAGGYVKWCYRIAHNLSIDTLRKKKPRAADDEEMERAADTKSLRPEEVYEHRVQAGQVQDCIQSLDEKYREVLILRYQEELSYEKIAEILELPVSTIETRIHRAKKMLREKLERKG
ncbi:MAG TPA: sigma-70 family RNA polymerase sigma factor [Planctomycetota bacterium]|nr:sigma-70 family RNA polymerase sigma factor [Planctomycetota bacterium]